MKCKDCKYYRFLKIGERGGEHGSCTLKSSPNHLDTRRSKTQACTTWFEEREEVRNRKCRTV